MVADEEKIRRFVRETLSEADLSTLTLGILKGRYLQHVGGIALSPEQRELLKRVVKAELLNMQNNQSESERSESATTGETPHTHTHLKRKRDEEEEEVKEKEEIITMAKMKKSRLDKSPEIQKRKQEEGKRNFSGGEIKEEKELPSDEEVEQKDRKQKGGKEEKMGMKSAQSSSESEEERPLGRNKSDSQSAEDMEESSDEEEKPLKKEQRDGTGAWPGSGGAFPGDSDSSSLPSLDDEEEEAEKPKDKAGLKERNKSDRKRKTQEERVTRESKEEDKSVFRLKRYIALCGVRRNYKKLLDGCSSVRAKVAVLKNELEELGVHGKPSIDKCKRARLKREEAQELAELDMSNIITTEGRPRRRAATAGVCVSPPHSTSRQHVESDFDSDSKSTKGHKRTTDWSRLRGIISDEDSD